MPLDIKKLHAQWTALEAENKHEEVKRLKAEALEEAKEDLKLALEGPQDKKGAALVHFAQISMALKPDPIMEEAAKILATPKPTPKPVAKEIPKPAEEPKSELPQYSEANSLFDKLIVFLLRWRMRK